MTAEAVNHFTIIAADLAETEAFYGTLLGLKPGYRPNLSFPGLWLYAGDQAVLHVVGGRAVPEPPAGVIDHMAFTARGLGATVAELKRRQLDYTLRKTPDGRTWQLFFNDPNGAKVELDFPPNEPAPPQ